MSFNQIYLSSNVRCFTYNFSNPHCTSLTRTYLVLKRAIANRLNPFEISYNKHLYGVKKHFWFLRTFYVGYYFIFVEELLTYNEGLIRTVYVLSYTEKLAAVTEYNAEGLLKCMKLKLKIYIELFLNCSFNKICSTYK